MRLTELPPRRSKDWSSAHDGEVEAVRKHPQNRHRDRKASREANLEPAPSQAGRSRGGGRVSPVQCWVLRTRTLRPPRSMEIESRSPL